MRADPTPEIEARRARDREYRRALREANPEKIRERTRAANQRYIAKPEARAKRSAYNKEYMRANRDRYWERHIFRKYGLTVDDWNSLFESQGNVCAICKTPEPNMLDRWHVDHCHESGEVRGILCGHCNALLGHAHDDQETLAAAATYLKKFRRAE